MRKGELSISFIIGAIIFTLIFMFVFIPMVSSLWNWMMNKPATGTQRSFDRLVLEIRHLAESEKVVPMFVDSKHKIVSYTKDENKPSQCKTGSCICICSAQGSCSSLSAPVCHTFDEPIVLSKFTLPPEENVVNYMIKLEISGTSRQISAERAY